MLNSKEYLTLNESTKANLKANKRILNGSHFGITATFAIRIDIIIFSDELKLEDI